MFGIASRRRLTLAFCTVLATLGFAATSQADTYRQVSVAASNTCAVTTATTVKCWGANGSGQLGNGTFDQSSNPTTVVTGPGGGPLVGVRSVTAGDTPCALMLNGTVKCWGWNGWAGYNLGLLGIDDFDHPDSPYPLTVVAAHGSTLPLSGVAELSGHCTRLVNGRVKCWGNNDGGELGDGTQTNRAAPVYVRTSEANPTPLDDVVSISALSTHSCAALQDSRVKCWGGNWWNQIDDTTDYYITGPRFIHTGPHHNQLLWGVRSVHLGWNHTCALMYNATAKCWGLNSNGALGRGFGADAGGQPFPYADYVVTATGSSTPVTGITELAGTCLVRSNTTAGCWGENTLGMLGDGTTVGTDSPSTVVTSETDSSPLTGVRSIDSGNSLHNCALLDDGSLRCWGANDQGQVGDGTLDTRLAPVAVG